MLAMSIPPRSVHGTTAGIARSCSQAEAGDREVVLCAPHHAGPGGCPMNHSRCLAALALFALAAPALADEKGNAKAGAAASKPGAAGEMERMKQAMEAASRPGPMHEWLKTNLAGSWTTEAKTWMTPGKEPVTGSGTA